MTDDETIPKLVPQAKSTRLKESESREFLERRANIENQDHGVVPDVGALPDFDHTNPAEVVREQMARKRAMQQLQESQKEIDRIRSQTQKTSGRV